MRIASVALIMVGALAMVLGTWEVASAQEDGCQITVKRLPNGDIEFMGCPPKPCAGTPPVCSGGLLNDGYGNWWAICACPGWGPSPLCTMGFLPYDPKIPNIGQVSCFPVMLCSICYFDWEDIECYCIG